MSHSIKQTKLRIRERIKLTEAKNYWCLLGCPSPKKLNLCLVHISMFRALSYHSKTWFELQTRSLADGSVTAKPTVMARDWSLGKKQRKQYKKGHIIKNIKDFTQVHKSFLQRLHFGGLLFYFIFGFSFTLSQILIFVCYLRFGLIILSQIRFHKTTALLCFQKKKYNGIVLLGFDLDLLCYVLLSINLN